MISGLVGENAIVVFLKLNMMVSLIILSLIHISLSRAGKIAANELFPSSPHLVPAPTYVPSKTDSYCVKTPTTSIPEFAQLLKGKSIILYFPPKCTAGFATFAVNRCV